MSEPRALSVFPCRSATEQRKNPLIGRSIRNRECIESDELLCLNRSGGRSRGVVCARAHREAGYFARRWRWWLWHAVDATTTQAAPERWRPERLVSPARRRQLPRAYPGHTTRPLKTSRPLRRRTKQAARLSPLRRKRVRCTHTQLQLAPSRRKQAIHRSLAGPRRSWISAAPR
jgi:hypothetical protein